MAFAVLLMLPFLRFVAVSSKKVSSKFYRLMRSASEPDLPAAFSQNYKNLLGIPVMFYAICLLLIVLNRIDQFFIVLSWQHSGIVRRIGHYVGQTSHQSGLEIGKYGPINDPFAVYCAPFQASVSAGPQCTTPTKYVISRLSPT
jgi:hypothetical protein